MALAVAFCALVAGAAHAQGIAWQDLTEEQRRLLAPHEERWNELDPARQEQIARGAQRWLISSQRCAPRAIARRRRAASRSGAT
jgi:hypothetical protein